jgi:hypothetical protein
MAVSFRQTRIRRRRSHRRRLKRDPAVVERGVPRCKQRVFCKTKHGF